MITTYKPEELTNAANPENDLIGIELPAENCGIIKGGWQPEEIEGITVILRNLPLYLNP